MRSEDLLIKSDKDGGIDEARTLTELEALFSHFHHPEMGIAETYRRIASSLREENPGVTWTWQYLHMVSRKAIEPSGKLAYGISNLYSEVVAGNSVKLEKVKILAPVGLVEPNSLLELGSRRCRRCNRPFLPKVNNQVYCSSNCRRNKVGTE